MTRRHGAASETSPFVSLPHGIPLSQDSGADQKICQRKTFNNEAEQGGLLKDKHGQTG